jgi:hypothetical protein
VQWFFREFDLEYDIKPIALKKHGLELKAYSDWVLTISDTSFSIASGFDALITKI